MILCNDKCNFNLIIRVVVSKYFQLLVTSRFRITALLYCAIQPTFFTKNFHENESIRRILGIARRHEAGKKRCLEALRFLSRPHYPRLLMKLVRLIGTAHESPATGR